VFSSIKLSGSYQAMMIVDDHDSMKNENVDDYSSSST
jgi:hypothetical protein